jgi:phytol kinase
LGWTLGGDLLRDCVLMVLCYGYIVSLILVSGVMGAHLNVSRKVSRKFLHAMIGNLPFVIPFFSLRIAPFLIAAPFIAVTYVASPYSPFVGLRNRLSRLSDLTEEGHHLGLILYAFSYTLLALLFPTSPWVIAAGVLPMAYGDSVAALVGERHGRTKYGFTSGKSLEGSLAMFAASLISLAVCMLFYSYLYGFTLAEKIVPALTVAVVVTVVECVSPKGFDNLTVPLLGALTFMLADGWF